MAAAGPETAEDSRTHFGIYSPGVTQLFPDGAIINLHPWEYNEVPVLLASPYVLESVVYGRKKENKQGEEVCAIIVPDLEQFRSTRQIFNNEPDIEAIRRVMSEEIAVINAQVADYKRIGRIDIRLQEFEKTSAKKIKRHLYIQNGHENQVN